MYSLAILLEKKKIELILNVIRCLFDILELYLFHITTQNIR
jgi:hypothetical protein